MKRAELIHTRDVNIRPCQGHFACRIRTPVECHQDDDMRAVLVLATPLYVDRMSGPLKNLLDRMLLPEPEFELRVGTAATRSGRA